MGNKLSKVRFRTLQPRDISVGKARRMFLIKVPNAVSVNGFQMEIPGNFVGSASPSTYFTSTGVGPITVVEDTGVTNWGTMVYPYWGFTYVGACKIKYRFISLIAAAGATQGTIWKLAACTARPGFISSYSNSTYEDIQAQPRARKRYTYNSAPNNHVRMTNYAATKQVMGLPLKSELSSDKDYYGATTFNGSGAPVYPWYHYFVCQTIDESTQTNDVLLECRITWYFKGQDRKLSVNQ